MKFDNFRKDRGTAGLTILLSVVTMLFVIGLLVMIFALMGGELMNSSSVLTTDSAVGTNQSGLTLTAGSNLTSCVTYDNGAISSITRLWNGTDNLNLTGSDYSYSGCDLRTTVASVYNLSDNLSVAYVISHSGSAYDTMNNTITGISDVTDWFPLFIVITAMVVLILLTVIIITAIRSSGLMGQGSA